MPLGPPTPCSPARWSSDALGLALADLIVTRLLPADSALTIAVDDTLFRRSGKKVFGAAWHHDGAAKGPKPQMEPGDNVGLRCAVDVHSGSVAERLFEKARARCMIHYGPRDRFSPRMLFAVDGGWLGRRVVGRGEDADGCSVEERGDVFDRVAVEGRVQIAGHVADMRGGQQSGCGA
jgi:hypothetical protein